MPVLVASVIAIVKEGLSLWMVFITTRKFAYNRQLYKRQVKAIESAEKYIFQVDSLIAYLNLDPSAKEDKKVGSALKDIARYRKRFFHYH